MSDCNHNCSSCGSSCSERTAPQSFLIDPNPNSSIKKIIGVVSGKGGVGKSSVTSMLAVLLRRKGYRVGIIDADITGPSIPNMFNLHTKAVGCEEGILPVVSETGIEVMSMNLLLEHEEDCVVYRGPVIAGVVKQFYTDVIWEDIDFLLVDMPPGTGDVPLTVFQSYPVDGIVIISTPQQLVSMIVSKACDMAAKMDIPVLGIVENMSYIKCPDCGKKLDLFKNSHVDEIAEEFSLNVLAKLPMMADVMEACDEGKVESIDHHYLDGAVDEIEALLQEGPSHITVAMPFVDEQVNQHFGHSEYFIIYKLNGTNIETTNIVKPFVSGHDKIADFLKSQGVNVIIAGNMGDGMYNALSSKGMLIFRGIQGKCADVIQDYLTGNIEDQETGKCDCSHHEEEHSCNCGNDDSCGCGNNGSCGCH